jgi:hypothetical protein
MICLLPFVRVWLFSDNIPSNRAKLMVVMVPGWSLSAVAFLLWRQRLRRPLIADLALLLMVVLALPSSRLDDSGLGGLAAFVASVFSAFVLCTALLVHVIFVRKARR